MHRIDHLSKDSTLALILKNVSIEPILPQENLFISLTKAIVSQQLSTKAAQTIYNRLLDLLGQSITPASILNLKEDELKAVGVSRQKTTYLQAVASFFDFHQDWTANNKSDEQVIDELTQIKGVGQWTVQMLLIFELGRENVFPLHDLGIRQAMQDLYKLSDSGKALDARLLDIASNWTPYKSFAVRALWQYRDKKKS